MALKASSIALLIIGLTFLQNVNGDGIVWIKFDYYESGCGDCDPMFTFCVDRPSSQISVDRRECSYGVVGESDHYHNTGHVTFGDNIKGIPNPWRVRFGSLHEREIMLVMRSRDDDLFGADHMITFATRLTETVYPNENRATNKEQTRRIREGSHLLVFQIKIFCIESFYGWDCSRKCIPEDSQRGHYDCDIETGDKICHEGWTGSNCHEDKDECALGFCKNGVCTNLNGDYYCHCDENYSGKNCSILGDPCEFFPCENNGTCMPVENQFSYTCNCSDPWTGQNCEMRIDPCEFAPCNNSGLCISNEENTNFTCDCEPPYEGEFCDIMVEPTTTTSDPTTTSLGPGKVGGPARITGEDSSKGFLYWHGLLIGLAFLILIILILLYFLFWRRRKEKENCPSGLPPGEVVRYADGNLAFENSMYNNRGLSNGHAKGVIRQQPPLPTTPTDDDMFNPLKPAIFLAENETQGATGGYDPDAPDEAGYVKPSTVEKEMKNAESAESQRAHSNPYADFRDVKGRPEYVEPHYQDLDEIAMNFKSLDQSSDTTPQENQYSEPTMSASSQPGNWNMAPPAKSESQYSDIPSNAPAIGLLSTPPVTLTGGENAYAPIDGDEESDLAMAQRISARRKNTLESPYAEPAVPASPLSTNSPSDAPDFKNQPYAEMSAPAHRTLSNGFADDYDDDEDIPSFGLPHVDTGYSSPVGTHTETPKEPLYADPKEPENIASLGGEYASPRSAAEPPAIPPKPEPRKLCPSGYEEYDPATPPIPALPCPASSSTDEPIETFDEANDTPDIIFPVSFSDFDEATPSTDNDANGGDKAPVKLPALFLENQSFGRSEI